MNKEKSYIAHSDAEAKALHDGSQTVIVIPLEPQPPRAVYRHSDRYWMTLEECGVAHGPWECLYAAGDAIAVKEGLYRAYGAVWNYSADNEEVSLDYWRDGQWMEQYHEWDREMESDECPAASMPLFAVRTRLIVKALACKQVQSITTMQEIAYCGRYMPDSDYTSRTYREHLIRRWDREHPQHLWVSNPWCWFVEVTKR
jgi:hypothetical protein